MTALQELKSKETPDVIENAILRLWFTSEPEEIKNLRAADQAATEYATLTARVKELEGLLKQTHGELQRIAATGQKVDQGLLIEARAALRGEA